MNRIIAPIKTGETGPQVANLQNALRLLLDRGVIRRLDSPNRPTAEELAKLSTQLVDEEAQTVYGKATERLVLYIQLQEGLGDGLRGVVESKTADRLNRFLKELGALDETGIDESSVRGRVTLANGMPAVGFVVRGRALNLRTFQALRREAVTDSDGRYEIIYSREPFSQTEKGKADLVIRVFSPDRAKDSDEPVVESPTLFNARLVAEVNLTVPVEVVQPPTLFENIGRAVAPHIGNVKVAELEEDKAQQDLSFLSGKTGIEKPTLGRFVLAHSLTLQGIQAEFWFALLGDSFFQFAENQSLKAQGTAILDSLSSLDAAFVRKSLTRAFNQKEISEAFREKVADWVEAFLTFIASHAVSPSTNPTFVKLALDHAGIEGAEKQEKFARLFHEHRALTQELLDALEQNRAFTGTEIADLRTSFQLSDLTRGDFSVVKMLKEEFDVRQPEKIRLLAKKSKSEWVNRVKEKFATGDITLPFEGSEVAGQKLFPAAEVYGETLERQFREAFPTTAFAGGLERAVQNGGTHGLSRAQDLGRFLEGHEQFELLKTPVDDFFKNNTHPEFRALANDEHFRLEVKAVQRVFKLAPTFEATDALMADGVHSAQQVYRMGETAFVQRYAESVGFTAEGARLAWQRAADTQAAVLTIVGDLKALDIEALPFALRSQQAAKALETFPDWNNLFKNGDLCECDHCRSVIGPAAYFADLLMFLKDRHAKSGERIKEMLFARRSDLGYLELSCQNVSTLLPYIDVVCEVLENALAAGDNDVELTGFATIPAGAAAARAAVAAAFSAHDISLHADWTLTEVVNPLVPDRWVARDDDEAYLLKKNGGPNFLAEKLRNTKASAAQLRAYPQYVNPKAYEKLSGAKYPMSLPFNLFSEEVRAAFEKGNLRRWELMRDFRGTATPNNATDVEIVAEYFGIGVDPYAAFDEKRVILNADPTVGGQQERWGETGGAWLTAVGNVPRFLQKTGLEYNELLALLDLTFINPAGDIVVHHLDDSCDSDQKVIEVLDEVKLDRIHRFLRLWRKLKGWQMWELDVVIRHASMGTRTIDEELLVNLFYFVELKRRLGANATVEQTLALFGDLNTETRFTKLHDKRADGLYEELFLNRKLIQPLDPAFAVSSVNLPPPTVQKLSEHQPALLAALGIREADLLLLKGWTTAGALYITDDLSLANLSFLWRHAWLSKQLKFKLEDWKELLGILDQDALVFAGPKEALEFLERTDGLGEAGFTPDQLRWLLAADRSAKAAPKEADAARFLLALRARLQAIQAENNPAQYDFLAVGTPTDEQQLATFLANILQKLNRDQIDADAFLATLRGRVVLEARAQDLPAGFAFPPGITGQTNNIPIIYDEADAVFRFTGRLTDNQRMTLLEDPLLAPLTDSAGATLTESPAYRNAIEELSRQSFAMVANYASTEVKVALAGGLALPADRPSIPIRYNTASQMLSFTGLMTIDERDALAAIATNPAAAIDELFDLPRLAVKFYEPVFTAPLDVLPPGVDFKTQLPAALAGRIVYDAEERALRFSGILSKDQQATLDALVPERLPPAVPLASEVAYHLAVNSLGEQPRAIAPDQRIWLTISDLDASQPANDTVAKRLAKAVTRGLNYLSATLSANAVVEQASFQLGISEELTRRLLTEYELFPESLLKRLTGPFASTPGVVDYANQSTTFDGWFWASRVAALWKKWSVTPEELDRIVTLTAGAKLLDFVKLPLNATAPMASWDKLLRTSRLLAMRNTLVETDMLEVLFKLNTGAYSAAAAASTPAVTEKHLFAEDVSRLNDGWIAADVEELITSLALAYPADYLLSESWERLRRVFSLLEQLNAGAATIIPFAAPVMKETHAKIIKDLLRSKFGAETWFTLSAEIQDVLRERKRDALVAFFLAQPQPADAPTGKWENANDLYAYYLLDVDMGSCQLTSRLVQASGSVQLFVQRCLMGLEPSVVVQADGPDGDSAWRWWTWMRKYRVWEANRKVFLWPENWIEPELRKDKSPFFRDMENELLQDEMNQYTAESAFSTFLEKLAGVAQLEIAGFYQEDDGDNTIVHVFGRNPGTEPHLYYYRRYDYRQWTPWEKVQLDIQGDYLIPAVINQRLFLFWPIFTEIPDEAKNSQMTVPVPGQKRFTPDKTTKKLRLQMAVSDYRQGRWAPKKVSTDFAESESYGVEIVKQNYRFFAVDRSKVDGRFTIEFDGHSVGSQAAADKTKADLVLTAVEAEKSRQDARTEKDSTHGILQDAKAAVAAVSVAVELAKIPVPQADDMVAVAMDLLKDAGAVLNIAKPAHVSTTDAHGAATTAKAAVLRAARGDIDATDDIQTFMDSLVALGNAFQAVEIQTQTAPPNNGKPKVIPLTQDAQKKAKQVAGDGAEALRTATSFKDSAAADSKAASKDLVRAIAALAEAETARDAFRADIAAHALLRGAFEIASCKGVPELVSSFGNFTQALRPERDSSGTDPLFLKWVELGPTPARLDAPQNDFTLENDRSLRTELLKETPWIFRMTPGWQLSYADELWLDGLMSLGSRDHPPPTMGSWLPFFYNDKKRTFFVLPAVGGGEGVVRSYPEIRNGFRQIEAFFERKVRTFVDGYVAVLTSTQRHQLELFLKPLFPEETPPPYPDAQLKDLVRRYFMRFLHFVLGGLAQQLFHARRFHFKNFYHPFVCDFAMLVDNPLKGIPALMARETQLKNTGFSFKQSYLPQLPVLDPASETFYPREDVDFTPDGAYSPYNWELFFHAPLLIANSLSRNQRFEEARDWYHFIFNPIGVEGPVPGGASVSKYWITKPFFETTDPLYIQQRIDSIMLLLAGDSSAPGYSAQAQANLEQTVVDWRTYPFEPHRIANYRTVAYQKTVVMKYLENLIAWGDYLFRQDSMESINEATQLYVLAAEILGARPKTIPPRVKPPVESFNELENQFDAFSNALVQVENLIPVLPGTGSSATNQAPLPMLYFCIPQNDKMLGYWDTVADRLYKIRHCMSIDGVVRQLSLFEPPIDPAALVKAVAAGLDIGAALADLNAPLPLYRFNVLLQKANEICSDVKALGGALLAALEKKDAEAMAQLRQTQEIRLLEAVKTVREMQIEEAKKNLEGLKKNQEFITVRRDYYRDIEKVSASEQLQQDKLEQALIAQQIAQVVNIAASVGHLVPDVKAGVSGFGGTPEAGFAFGGSQLGSSLQAVAGGFSVWSTAENHNANKASISAGHERRFDDWKFQERLANKELEQIEKTIAAAELRITLAQKELDNHVLQIDNALATDAFMRSKYTNQELYQWQIGQVSGVYFQNYKLAYDLAKRAERCFRFELGLQDSSYISVGYWDSLKKGLLSGERLQYDLRRLETAYLEQNRREFELTKHISLALLDPLALVKLRETGRCFFNLPEEIFDLDYPGHYFRRIKSVSLTLPCVVGPYTTVPCTLRLLRNTIRISSATTNGYARKTDGELPADDDRFIESNIPVKAIAASSAQNDSGMFEFSFRDERYLPFEGAGAVSEWALELFTDLPSNNDDPSHPDFGKLLRQFDYETIADAVLHVKYTAREDAGAFKNKAVVHLRNYYRDDERTHSMRALNLRQEFPTEWNRFLNPVTAANGNGNVLEVEISPRLFARQDANKKLTVNTLWLLARSTNKTGTYNVVMAPPFPSPPIPVPPATTALDPNRMILAPVNQFGGLHFTQRDVSGLGIELSSEGTPVKWRLAMTRSGGNLKEELEDLILVLGYQWT